MYLDVPRCIQNVPIPLRWFKCPDHFERMVTYSKPIHISIWIDTKSYTSCAWSLITSHLQKPTLDSSQNVVHAPDRNAHGHTEWSQISGSISNKTAESSRSGGVLSLKSRISSVFRCAKCTPAPTLSLQPAFDDEKYAFENSLKSRSVHQDWRIFHQA